MKEIFDPGRGWQSGPDVDRDGEDEDPEFDYFGRVLDWEASRNDPPEDEETDDEEL